MRVGKHEHNVSNSDFYSILHNIIIAAQGYVNDFNGEERSTSNVASATDKTMFTYLPAYLEIHDNNIQLDYCRLAHRMFTGEEFYIIYPNTIAYAIDHGAC